MCYINLNSELQAGISVAIRIHVLTLNLRQMELCENQLLKNGNKPCTYKLHSELPKRLISSLPSRFDLIHFIRQF